MNIVLGITGSIAACKAPEIISQLKINQHNLKVILTKQGAKFVTPLTCQALLGSNVYIDFESEKSLDQMDHISIAKWCDILLIAPASANIIAKLANGIADDLLSTIFLATTAKTFLAPAMNTNMWHHQIVQNNIAKLKEYNVKILGPEHGLLACNSIGLGRMLEPSKIISNILTKPTTNIKALITVGCTQEKIDPIRYISNNSSGKMGLALVQALIDQGINVTCVLGPCNEPLPNGAKYIKITSAEEMYAACMSEIDDKQLFIGCAAVANYTPAKISNSKIKSNVNFAIKFNKTKDILKSIATRDNRPNFVVGFAAETENLIQNAKKKLNNKKCDMIIANLITTTSGMRSIDNAVSILDKAETINLALENKTSLAKKIIAIILNKANEKHLQIR